ncbi:MAG: hypothetical protein ACXVCY_14950 [Pseudobdellovibrionaceae bacterium]
MSKLIGALIILIFSQIANASDADECLEKIDKIYTSSGQKSDFLAGPGYVTIAGEGPVKVYSSKGLVTIDGLGCSMDKNKKMSEAVGDVFYGLVLHMQIGLTKDKPRKAIFKNEDMLRRINEAAKFCRVYSSDLMDKALEMLNIEDSEQGKIQRKGVH